MWLTGSVEAGSDLLGRDTQRSGIWDTDGCGGSSSGWFAAVEVVFGWAGTGGGSTMEGGEQCLLLRATSHSMSTVSAGEGESDDIPLTG
jgi:hypothetical protein